MYFPLMALLFVGLIVPSLPRVHAINGDGVSTTNLVSVSTTINNLEICLDGEDNDNDGEVDEPEPLCTPRPINFLVEYCFNNVDDDGDRAIDELDDCILVELCNNEDDDDGDGRVDEQGCKFIIISTSTSTTNETNETRIVDLMISESGTTGTGDTLLNYPLGTDTVDMTRGFNIFTACPGFSPTTTEVSGPEPLYAPNAWRGIISADVSLNELIDALGDSMVFTLEIIAGFSDINNPSISANLVTTQRTDEPIELENIGIDEDCVKVTAVNEEMNGLTPIPNTNNSAALSGEQEDLNIISDRKDPKRPVLETRVDALTLNPVTSACSPTFNTARYSIMGEVSGLSEELGELDGEQSVTFNIISDLTPKLTIAGTDDSPIAAQIEVDPLEEDAKILTFNIVKIDTACSKTGA
jgi:hypothetical protein